MIKNSSIVFIVCLLELFGTVAAEASPPAFVLRLNQIGRTARPIGVLADLSNPEPVANKRFVDPEPVSPQAATAIALVPGFLVHGLGHFYAHDYRTATILFGVQAVSAVWFMAETFQGFLEDSHDPSTTIQVATASAYFGTWLYDIFHAGTAAEKYNAKFRFSLQPRCDGAVLCVNIGLD